MGQAESYRAAECRGRTDHRGGMGRRFVHIKWRHASRALIAISLLGGFACITTWQGFAHADRPDSSIDAGRSSAPPERPLPAHSDEKSSLQGDGSPTRRANSISVDDHDREWQPLFTGMSLDGWDAVINRRADLKDPEHIFQVKDGAIHVYRDHEVGTAVKLGYLATTAEYAYYHLRFEYKWGEKKFAPRVNHPRDAGLLFHAGPKIARLWPQSLECQVMENCVGDCFTVENTRVTTTVEPGTLKEGAACYQASTDGGVLSTIGGNTIRINRSEDYEIPNQWNIVDIIVRGAEGASFVVNGHEVFCATDLRRLDTDKQWVPLTHGRILLQAEYAEVLYRNIKIRQIADGPLHPPRL